MGQFIVPSLRPAFSNFRFYRTVWAETYLFLTETGSMQ